MGGGVCHRVNETLFICETSEGNIVKKKGGGMGVEDIFFPCSLRVYFLLEISIRFAQKVASACASLSVSLSESIVLD